MHRLVFAALALAITVASAPARADVAADVKRAFTAFVDGVGKQQLGKVELFLAPIDVDDGAETNAAAVPPAAKLAEIAALIPKPTVTVLAVHPAPSGKSAWLTAEIAARVPRDDKPRDEKLRASAFLVLDGGAWRVTAAHWSAPMPDHRDTRCGMMSFVWHPKPSVPNELAPLVAQLFGTRGDADLAPFRTLLSDDKRASLFGSAPKETFTGGARIKALFRTWKVSLANEPTNQMKTARAGGDGELAWVVAGAVAEHALCTMYRAMFVLAKERAGWRIVHQHYSKPI